ncbi:MAG TPA: hypothetical protein ENN78_02615 [Candidatus Omnitrophica bacterium]|nr:hypothetical protein [Candidatus Omnitrophota bacterium]
MYEARTTVKIEERKTIAGLLTEWIVYTPADIMESQTKLITGFPVMKRAAFMLGMIRDDASVSEVDNIVKQLQGHILTQRIRNTNIIEITASSSDPEEAMIFANTVANAYVEENLLEKNKQARTTRVFIEEQLSALEERMKDTEEQLKTFGDEVEDVKLGAPIQEKLTELEFERIALIQKYTPSHPRIIRIEKQIEDLKSQIENFSGQELVYARLKREAEVNSKLYEMLKTKLEEARITEAQKVGDVSIVDPAGLPVSPIGPNKLATVFFGGLAGIILGLMLAFVIESTDTSIGTIEDVESIAKLPVLGVVPPVSYKTPDEQDEHSFFKRLLWQHLPRRQPVTDTAHARLISYYEPRSLVAEAYRTIRTNLKIGPSVKTLLITSAGPQEGKTAVAVNLGLVIAQTGLKVLLVSSDLRRPAIASTFGVKKEPGLSEVLGKRVSLNKALLNVSDIMLGNIKLDEIMRAAPGIENLWILPSGHITANPAELLESEELARLIDEAKKRFDFVIFDSPPVLPVTDAVLLASKVDSTVLVYEAGRIARGALLRAKAQIEAAGAKIKGVILNHIKSGAETTLSYPYYKGERYYSEEPEKPPKEI